MGSSKKTKAELLKEVESLRAHIENLESNRLKPAGVERVPDVCGDHATGSEGTASGTPVHTALDALPIPLVICRSSDAVILYVSPMMESVFGVPGGTAIGRRVTDCYGDPADWEVLLGELHRQGSVHSCEVLVRKTDGTLLGAGVSMRPMTYDGQPAVFCAYSDVADRKKIEEELRDGERRYQAIVEDQTELICRWRPDGTHTFVNEAYCRCFGKRSEELLGHGLMDLIPRQDHEKVQSHFAALNRENPVASHEHLVIADGGEIRLHQWTDRAIFDSDDNIVEYQSVGRDITERKRAEEELRWSEERFRTVVEASKDAVIAIDADGAVFIFNAAAERMFGRSKKEMAGQPLDCLMPEEHRARHTSYVSSFFGSGKPDGAVGRTLELLALRKDGVQFPIELSLSSARYRDQHLVVAIIRDITSRREAEVELRKFKAISDRTPHGHAIADLDGRLLYVNDAFAEMHGYSPEELLGEHLSVFHTEEQMARVIELIEPLAGGGSFADEEVWHKRRDGSVFPTLMDSIVVTDESGSPLFLSGMATDISDRKKTEEELRRQALVFNNINDGVLITDNRGRISDLNPAAERLFGYPRAELLGQTPEVLDRPEEAGQLTQSIRQSISEEGHWGGEINIVRKDGTERICEAFVVPLRNERHEWIGTVSVNRDITQRKEAEVALRTAEEQLRSTLSSMSDLVFVLDQDGKFVDYHQPSDHADLYAPPEKFLGAHYSEILPPDVATLLDSAITQCMSTGESQQYDYALEIAGKTTWYSARTSVRRDADGTPAGVTIVARNITDRKRGEEALRESEARLNNIVGQAHDSIIEIGLTPEGDPCIKNCNEATLRMYGYTREEMIGKPIYELDTELSRDDLRDIDRRALTEEIAIFEAIQTRKDGSRFPVEISPQIVRIPGQNPIRIGVQRDITERKRAEEALRASEDRYRSLVEVSPDLIAVHTEEAVVFVNHAGVRLLEAKDPREIVGKPVLQFVVPEERDRIGKRIRGALEDNRPRPLDETILAGLSGTRIAVEVAAVPFVFNGERAIQVVARDISERKRAEENLRESRNRYQSLFEDSPVLLREVDMSGVLERLRGLQAGGVSDLLAYFDAHPEEVMRCARMARIVAINLASVEFYGARSKEELIARVDDTLSTPGHIDRVKEQLIALSEGRIPAPFDATVKTLSGETRHLSVHLSVPGWAHGGLTTIIYASADITERRRMEEERARLQAQLQHAHKMEAVGALASGIAHDFNNLLTAIFGYTDMAKTSLPDDHSAIRSMEMVEQAAKQARGVTNALLTFSHKGTAEKTPVNLAESVSDTTRLLRRFLPAAIEVSEDLSDHDAVWVRADATQLQQVWMNLAINARDAMPLGGRLHVDLRVVPLDEPMPAADSHATKRPTAIVTISDTGKGMSEETREHIFEPFFTTKPRGQGTGLGLSVIHAIVEDHGGEIQVESQEGCGVQISVSLPCCNPPETLPDEARHRRQKPGHGEHVIVVEDNEHVRSIMTSSLRSQGYEVTAAADTAEATEALKRHGETVRLVVLDLDIPGTGSRAVADEIHRVKPNASVLVVTGGTGLSVAETAHGGNTDLLRKPFSMSELHKRVARMLEGGTEMGAPDG
ncbi:MAG: PAS domain S-box protein [Planctomycetota bacterium]